MVEGSGMYLNFVCQSVGLPVTEIRKMAEGNSFLEGMVRGNLFWEDLLWVTYGQESYFNLAKTLYKENQKTGMEVPGHKKRCEELKEKYDFL